MRFFTAILGMTALTIAIVAEYFSIYGIIKSFDVTVAVMAGVLGLGKLVTTSYLYRFWDKIGKIRYYYLFGVIILMLFTSSGIVGYLTASYQDSTFQLEQIDTKKILFEEEFSRLKEDKTTLLAEKQSIQKNMDEELSGLTMEFKSRYYDSKVRGQVVKRYQPLISLKDSTISVINNKLLDVQSKIADIKLGRLDVEKEIGPIVSFAKIFNLTINQVIGYFILLIIFVFDPLAMALVIAYNRALEEDRRRNPPLKKLEKKVEKLIDIQPNLIETKITTEKPSVSEEKGEVSEEIKELVDVEIEAIKEATMKEAEEKESEQNIYAEMETEEVVNSLDNLDEKTKRLIAQKKNRSNLL